jgi:multidrug efflux pump subunit AcrB
MSVVEAALKRPYTVVAVLILIALMGIGAALRMPVDIFPEIDIPVVAVVWTYNGMSAEDMQNRILTLHQRQLASLVDDISRIEAVSYQGVGVEKVYLHEGADVTRAISQLASSALVVLNGGAQVHAAEYHTAPGVALRCNRRADHTAEFVEQIPS